MMELIHMSKYDCLKANQDFIIVYKLFNKSYFVNDNSNRYLIIKKIILPAIVLFNGC